MTDAGFGVLVLVVLVLLALPRERPEGAPEGESRPSLAQVNQVLLFVVLAGVILFALGIIRCEAAIRT